MPACPCLLQLVQALSPTREARRLEKLNSWSKNAAELQNFPYNEIIVSRIMRL